MNNTNDNNSRRQFLTTIRDIVLLTIHFEFMVDQSLDECVNSITAFSRPKTRLLNAVSRTVWIQEKEGSQHFEMRILRYGRGMSYNSAIATGTIEAGNQDAEKTLVTGKIRVGILFIAMVGFPLGIFFTSTFGDVMKSPTFYLFVLTLSSFYILRHLKDYRDLHNYMRDNFSQDTERI